MADIAPSIYKTKMFKSKVFATTLLSLCYLNCSIAETSIAEKNYNPFVVISSSAEVGKITIDKCPSEMVLVEGNYCQKVEQKCEVWLDDPLTNNYARCKKYYRSLCVGERLYMKFCIDKFEYTEPGETLPKVNVNFYEAKKICEGDGKRLCRESEWNFAGEGEEMLVYGVSNERSGWRSDHPLCNYDIEKDLGAVGHLKDHRMPSSSLMGCISPFGVVSMTGNVDELTIKDTTPGDYQSALKGGWWGCLRNRIRPATTKHNEEYKDIQVGFRCCK